MSSPDANRKAETEANELYWGSDMSVNQIAEELDLSKGTLYGMIRPLPAGLACPACAEELVFPNRTARERRSVSCAVCGWEGDEADAENFGAEEGVALPDREEIEPASAMPLLTGRNRTILGGALVGAAAGLALVIWARRR